MSQAQAGKATKSPATHALVDSTRLQDLWNALIGLRIINALSLATFFQPDEYYQALEPAWEMVFGRGKVEWNYGAYDGPWITWEWRNQVRSSIYPWLYAGVYKITSIIATTLFPPVVQVKLLLFAPKLIQAFGAGIMDFYTFQLAGRVYGPYSTEAWATLALSVFSPWQWLASTRSMSNSFETTLTVMALYYWPWEWVKGSKDSQARAKDTNNLMYTVLLAGTASVLRPTNVIIWICLALFTLPRANQREFFAIVNAASIWGSVVLGVSMGADYLYYGEVTFPALNFVTFNIGEGVSQFYGVNRIDYYFTEGIPMLLTTALPFAITGLSQALAGRFLTLPADTESGTTNPSVLRSLATVAVALPVALTFVVHKEARFIYPILPILLVIISRPVIAFFHPFPNPTSGLRKFLLIGAVAINVILAIYVGFFHNRGLISVMSYLRGEHERHNPDMVNHGITTDINATSVAFLMPCHSTPWRSHFVYNEINAWSLTCEPPLNLTKEEEDDIENYMDEADTFYANVDRWVRIEFGTQRRSWPDYVVFFEHLFPEMKKMVAKYSYEVAWRGYNSFWHDDWRRKGDVIIWAKTIPYGGKGRRDDPLVELPEDENDEEGTRLLREGLGDEVFDKMQLAGKVVGAPKKKGAQEGATAASPDESLGETTDEATAATAASTDK